MSPIDPDTTARLNKLSERVAELREERAEFRERLDTLDETVEEHSKRNSQFRIALETHQRDMLASVEKVHATLAEQNRIAAATAAEQARITAANAATVAHHMTVEETREALRAEREAEAEKRKAAFYRLMAFLLPAALAVSSGAAWTIKFLLAHH